MGCPSLVEPGHDSVSNPPRPSSTVCVIHQSDELEVLMVRRSASARFMANAWVFPGGVVDAEDSLPTALRHVGGLAEDSDQGPWLAAAFREVVEETGIWLTDPPLVESLGDEPVFVVAAQENRVFPTGNVAYFANWITPTMVPVRFNTRFFMVAVDERIEAEPDQAEISAAEFVSPSEALRRAEAGEWLVPFPTQRTLHELAAYESVDAALDEWHHRQVVSVQPRMRVADDGSLEVVMPNEPGFDDLEDVEPDPDVLAKAAKAAAEKGKPIAEVSVDGD